MKGKECERRKERWTTEQEERYIQGEGEGEGWQTTQVFYSSRE